MSGVGPLFSDDHSDDERILNAVSQFVELCQEYLEDDEPSDSRPTKKKKIYVYRDREDANESFFADYFSETLRWNESIFCRRFRMRRSLFLRIVSTLEAREEYFEQRVVALGRLGFTPIKKCTVALRQLSNGNSADHYDEYLHIAKSTTIECLKKLCRAIIEAFGDEYLRKPTVDDCRSLLKMHEEKHDFPDMLGSIDCMHWA